MEEDRKKTRRAFLQTGAALGISVAGGAAINKISDAHFDEASEAVTALAEATINESASHAQTARMPERVLGRTGVKVPVFGLGGAGQTPLSQNGQERASIPIIEKALQLGIRYFDTAANYGPSEENYGKVLPPHRKNIFLASKTDSRFRDGALRELERSLKRLKTDHLDLWQMHHVSFQAELDTMFSKGGVIEAIEEAKRQKLIRFAGISGHHEPDIIAEGLRRYNFDTTLISINAADVHHPRSFIKTVLPIARSKNTGVIAMKVPAYGRLLKPGVLDGMEQALNYTLSQPGVHCCVVAAETPEQLTRNVEAARRFVELNASQLASIEQRTAKVWEEVSFYRAWT
jgi:aryl-alcohol dehydrogenase-like predicted oxidoreductase